MRQATQSFAFKYLFKFEEVMPPSSVLLYLMNEKIRGKKKD